MKNHFKKFGLIGLVAVMLIASVGMLGGCGRGEAPTLSDLPIETQERIRQDYLEQLATNPNATLEDIQITRYFGTFNDVVVIGFRSSGLPDLVAPIRIGRVRFDGVAVTFVFAWDDGELTNLRYTHEQNVLSNRSLRAIARQLPRI